MNDCNNDFDRFEIYQNLTICSNLLINTKHILVGGDDFYPIVIRKGETPRVWIKAIALAKDGHKQVVELVNDSISTYSGVDVKSSKHGIKISFQEKEIIVGGNHNNDSLEIIKLDFRPIGMNIYGDHHGLTIDGISMSGNTSVNGSVMFAFGL